jgi:hypothetical protein
MMEQKWQTVPQAKLFAKETWGAGVWVKGSDR